MKVVEVILQEGKMSLDRAIRSAAPNEHRQLMHDVYQQMREHGIRWNTFVDADNTAILRLAVILKQPNWVQHLGKWIRQNRWIDTEGMYHTFLYLYDEENGIEIEPDIAVEYHSEPAEPEVNFAGGVQIDDVVFLENFEIGGKSYFAKESLYDHEELHRFMQKDFEDRLIEDIEEHEMEKMQHMYRRR